MTTPTPLWSDDKIRRSVLQLDLRTYQDEFVELLIKDMRDDYERDKAFWRDHIATQAARIASLEAALAEARKLVPSVDVLAAIEGVAHNNKIMGDRAFAVRQWLVLFDNQTVGKEQGDE